jgi:hypothetical protein
MRCAAPPTPAHDALMTMYRLRFNEQIDLVKAKQLPEIWRPH